MKNISVVSLAVIILLLLSASVFADDVYLEEWEDGTTAGWEGANIVSTVQWNAMDGHPDGCLVITGISNGTKRVGAVTTVRAATGDFWRKAIGIIEFDVSCADGVNYLALLRIHYKNANDEVSAWLHRFHISTEGGGAWTRVAFNLHPDWNDADAKNAGWIQSSNAPSFHEALANVYSVDIMFLGGTDVTARIDNFRLGSPGSCMPNLPDPVLLFEGRSIAGDFQLRWDFAIENWQEFPPELFLSAPELPPCGRNEGAPRSFIRFVTSEGEVLAEKCTVTSPDQLQDIGFIADLTRPTRIYFELYDRQCDVVYRSNEVTAEFSNDPPVARAGEDMLIECSGETTPVTVDGSQSADPNGDDITFEWYAKGVTFDDPHAATTVGHFPLGTHLVVLKVADEFTYKTDVVEITVVDTHAPKLKVVLDRTILWPPNHKYHDVHASIVAGDCDPATKVSLMSITCDGPQTDGAMPVVRNAEYGTEDTDFQLLAERNGNETGRTYEIVFMAWDSGFHFSSDTVRVYVPHDRSDNAMHEVASKVLPAKASLDYAYPNPFNPAIRLGYSVPQDGGVQLAVYDVSGRLVRRLVSSRKSAGVYETFWNAIDDKGVAVPSGVYFVRFQTADTRITRKIVLMK